MPSRNVSARLRLARQVSMAPVQSRAPISQSVRPALTPPPAPINSSFTTLFTVNGCCKGVQGPSSGAEFAPVCTPVRCPRCRNENFACERLLHVNAKHATTYSARSYNTLCAAHAPAHRVFLFTSQVLMDPHDDGHSSATSLTTPGLSGRVTSFPLLLTNTRSPGTWKPWKQAPPAVPPRESDFKRNFVGASARWRNFVLFFINSRRSWRGIPALVPSPAPLG